MSKRLPPEPDRQQLRLGFEASQPDGRRWCATCQCWCDEALYDLFHGFGKHPRRPYDSETAGGVRDVSPIVVGRKSGG